ncbi:YebC/PmpR family DNA-binding transcriptional regulator, partial [Helicobacter sp. MIT 14-3879]|uniref:YebC/PmpR family DNA-binding transcriptional regulator n=1 Tax=Helicobacter sp. MIT 14-3879 TaxID=2040649 RepID=UPI000E3AC73C
LYLIDYGLDSLQQYEIQDSIMQNENRYIAYCQYENFGQFASGLESLNIIPLSAKLVRIPTNPITLKEEQIIELEKLLDKIEDDPDVQAVYTNLA